MLNLHRSSTITRVILCVVGLVFFGVGLLQAMPLRAMFEVAACCVGLALPERRRRYDYREHG